MSGPAENLSFVARRLIQFEQRFAQAEPQRKLDSATLFARISASLHALVADLGRDQVPHEACRDLVLYSTRLRDLADAGLGAAEAERLAHVMGEASDKESLYLQYRSAADRKSLLEEVEKAAILIQALANGLCAIPPVPPVPPGRVESPA